MVRIRYTGTRPRLLDGFYIHNDEVRNVSEKTAEGLVGDSDFVFLDAAPTPAPLSASQTSPQIREERPNLEGEKKLVKVRKPRGKKK